MLFARALVFFEGETEEIALPTFAQAYFKQDIHSLGIGFIGVGSDGNYLPFLRMANSFSISWYVFADGEQNARKKLAVAATNIGIVEIVKIPNIIILPDGLNWEKYVIEEGYGDAISTMLDALHKEPSYIDNYIKSYSAQKEKGGKPRDYEKDSDGGRKRAMKHILLAYKLHYAKPLAEHILGLSDKKRHFPLKVKSLLERMAQDLEIDI